MYQVIAHTPTAGSGSSVDCRKVGPFESRKIAEDAAARLVDDPRRWASIRIHEEDESTDDSDE